jgi:hypothetical protein
MGAPESSSSNHTKSVVGLLTTLAQSGHAWVQFGTLILIALTGFGNWVATWNSADRNRTEIEISRRVAWEGEQRIKAELVRQVAEIHRWMQDATDEFHRGNADPAENRKSLKVFQSELTDFESRQLTALENQNRMLENQAKILNEIHSFVKEREREREKEKGWNPKRNQ